MRKIIRLIFLTITLTLLIIFLVLNLTSKQVTSEIMTEIWNSIIPQETVDNIKDNKITNWFNDLKNNEKVQNFMDKYLSEDINKVKDKVNEVTDKAKKEVDKAVDEFLKEQEEKLSPSQKFALQVYRLVTDAKSKGVLMVLIVINILLIALAAKSIYKWICPTSISVALSGLSLLLLTEWVKTKIYSLIKINVTLSVLNKPAYILLISGVVVFFIYLVLTKILNVNKNSKEDKE